MGHLRAGGRRAAALPTRDRGAGPADPPRAGPTSRRIRPRRAHAPAGPRGRGAAPPARLRPRRAQARAGRGGRGAPPPAGLRRPTPPPRPDGQIELEAMRLYGLPEAAPALLCGTPTLPVGQREFAAETTLFADVLFYQ